MSERTKHTPGPWHVERFDELPIYAVCNSNTVSYDSSICNVFSESNAQLIAAAPDLLEWLEAAVDVLEGQRESGEPSGAFDIDGARAVIAKAKGEQC